MASTELLPRCQDVAWPFPSSRTYLYSKTAPAGSCKARCHLCPGVHCSSGLPDRVQAPAGEGEWSVSHLPLALWDFYSAAKGAASFMSVLTSNVTAQPGVSDAALACCLLLASEGTLWAVQSLCRLLATRSIP